MYTVYGKDQCPACKDAVTLLETREKEFKYIKIVQSTLDTNDAEIERSAFMEKFPGVRTVPLIIDSEGNQFNINTLTESLNK